MAPAAIGVCVLGANGAFLGPYIARECLSRRLRTRLLVRPGWEASPDKREKLAALRDAGAELVDGDADDPGSLDAAFAGVQVVISALGGWGPLERAHDNIYAACRRAGVRRVVPAQFGIDVLSFTDEELVVDYLRTKRRWNAAAVASGVPYTVVSQGAFSEWLLSPDMCPFMHPATRTADVAGDVSAPPVPGYVFTSLADTARLVLDCALDPSCANGRVSVAGSVLSAAGLAAALSAATGEAWSLRSVATVAGAAARARDQASGTGDAFLGHMLAGYATGDFLRGFAPPFLVDTLQRYGWEPETLEAAARRVFGSRGEAAAAAGGA